MDVGRKGTDSLMCGIVGLAAAPSRPLPPDIDWAVAALSHRGPDAHGAFISAPFALGHTRLSIIDLSEAGAQPMHSADGRLVMTYNGEIYNFAELKRDLDQHGIRLRGHSDTEVLLESYRLYGPDVLARLNGIFALGIVDLEKREMVVARDAAGIKPVYIADGPFGFAFASEIKALLAVAPIERTIDADAVRQYLTFLWSPGERTMLRGVKKLDPGRALLVRDGSVARSWQFATLPAYDPRRDWTVETCSNALATSLDEAVERQMISDAPVGAFLSGGVDSTAIVAAAKRTAPGLRCYTMAIAEGEQREIHDPEKIQRGVVLEQLLHVSDLQAHAAENVAGLIPCACIEEDDVVFYNVQLLDERGFFVLAEEFPKRALVFQHTVCVALHLDEGELFHLHASFGGQLVQTNHLTGGDAGEAFRIDGAHHTTAVEDALEDFEAGVCEHVAHVIDLKTEPRVRLV